MISSRPGLRRSPVTGASAGTGDERSIKGTGLKAAKCTSLV